MCWGRSRHLPNRRRGPLGARRARPRAAAVDDSCRDAVAEAAEAAEGWMRAQTDTIGTSCRDSVSDVSDARGSGPRAAQRSTSDNSPAARSRWVTGEKACRKSNAATLRTMILSAAGPEAGEEAGRGQAQHSWHLLCRDNVGGRSEEAVRGRAQAQRSRHLMPRRCGRPAPQPGERPERKEAEGRCKRRPVDTSGRDMVGGRPRGAVSAVAGEETGRAPRAGQAL